MSTLAAWLHDIDPYALGPIRWYGLSYLLGFFIGYLLIRRVTSVGQSTLDPKRVADLIVTLALGIVIGGRLGYVLFYRINLLWEFESAFPFWGVLAINKGGMASHGGILGGIIATFWFARKHHQPLLHLLDLFAFAAPLGLFFGRIANFINGELIGRKVADTFPLAVKFPQEMFDWSADRIEPLIRAYNTQAAEPFVGSASQFVYFAIEKIQQGSATMRTVIEPALTARHPSQLYAAVLEGLVVFAVLALWWIKPRRPGTVAGLFCITYGTVRIIDEFFRRPDMHLIHQEFQTLHITRGQWLSALLILIGVVGWIITARKPATPLGSWRTAK